jgi:hypothetical protein
VPVRRIKSDLVVGELEEVGLGDGLLSPDVDNEKREQEQQLQHALYSGPVSRCSTVSYFRYLRKLSRNTADERSGQTLIQ